MVFLTPNRRREDKRSDISALTGARLLSLLFVTLLQEELRPLPDLRRTKWCRLVFHGLVCHDAHCPYAHTKEQLKTNAQDLVSYKTSYCKYYQKGNCLSGGNCRYSSSSAPPTCQFCSRYFHSSTHLCNDFYA